MNTITRKFAWRFIAGFATVLAWAGAAAAQTVVVGTGDPDVDVPAVQAAVDQGGEVILQGHFSFDRPPTVPTPYGRFAMVLVSTAVAISGAGGEHDDDGDMTTIEGGTIPFFVAAPGASVGIRRLRFIHVTGTAIHVYAVSGLVIASCKIEGVLTGGFGGIRIGTSRNLPTPANPGKPENISGTLLVANNDIDVGGTASDEHLGITIWSVGVPGAEVEAYVSGNTIRNVTARGIYPDRAVGRMFVEGNVITTGTVSGPEPPIGIIARNLGSHVIAHNRVHAQWATREARGIVVTSDAVAWPIIGAVVVDNDVSMEAPEGTIFGDQSAAIDIRGNGGAAQDNVVLNNMIRGRARAALAVDLTAGMGSAAANNAFVLNRFDDFEATLADVFVGEGVTNTLIVGQGTVEDHGVGTVIVPLPLKRDDKR